MPNYIQLTGTLQFLDAHEIQERDFNVVTRAFQNNNTQHWELRDTGGGFTIQQVSSGRFLDAHEIESLDFRVVTRPQQNNNTQLWRIIQYVVGGTQQVRIQQVSSGRFLEGYITGNDFQVVTRPQANTSVQVWQIHDADRFDPNEG
jgi:Ricin-type beta-trefoil lectin domain-like